MKKTNLAAMMAVMGGLSIATAACSQGGEDTSADTAADQTSMAEAGGCAAVGCCAAAGCEAKGCCAAAEGCEAAGCEAKGCCAAAG